MSIRVSGTDQIQASDALTKWLWPIRFCTPFKASVVRTARSAFTIHSQLELFSAHKRV